MQNKHPDSLEIFSESADLASMAEDRAVARKLFEQLGDRYLADTWCTPDRFTRCRRWAQTGQ